MIRYNKKSNKFFVYLTISLIIHFAIILFLPFGSIGVMGNNKSKNQFSYIQFVEYRPKVDHVKPVKKISKENSISKKDKNKLVSNLNNKDNTEKLVEEKTKNNTEIKKENRPVQKSKVETKVQTNSSKDEVLESKVPAKPKSKDIISAEDSEIEVEINEKESNVNKNIKSLEEEQSSKTNTPPPLPTAGDLIIGAPIPTYPKDLVGRALTGQVQLQVHVKEDGQVERVDIIKSSKIEKMDRTAQLTLEKGWKFKTYKQPYSLKINIEYKIDNMGNPQVEVIQDKLTFK